jgi:YD repeat-containing protein
MKNLFILSLILIAPLLCHSQQSTVIISEVLYDTPLNEATGSENAHDGEFVSLYNYGDQPVDISGWRIEATSINTATSPSYSCFFPEETFLFPHRLAIMCFCAEGSTFRVDSFYNSFIPANTLHAGFYQNSMILPNKRTHLKIYDTNDYIQDEMIYDGDDSAPSGELLLRAKNGQNLTRAGNLSASLQRKNISIGSEDQHVFHRADYSSGTKSYVRFFSFNIDSTLSLTTEQGMQKVRGTNNSGGDVTIHETEPNSVLELFPPSPDAASLGKYGDHPVSLSTGLVDISIPLFEIGTKRIKLPINISYHSSGIKVDEVASSVGLGWSLNAGGCIAVTVRSTPDNAYSNYNWQLTADSLYKISNETNRNKFIFEQIEIGKDYLLIGPCMDNKESDIYSYNFNGYSGQFYYNNKGEIVKLNQDGLKIEYDGGYVITTQDGIQYLFYGFIEQSKIIRASSSTTYSCNNGVTNYSAYYLKKIKDLTTNDTITFHYKDMGESITNYPLFNGMQKVKQFIDGVFGDPYSDIPQVDFTSIKTSNIYALEEIVFPGGRLKITNVENAGKEERDARLFYVSDIKLYSNNNTSDAVKTVKFNHDYFISSEGNDYKKSHRLRLDGVTINGDQNYQFKYNEKRLPAYFDSANRQAYLDNPSPNNNFSQDEWGYYNGAKNRTLFMNYADILPAGNNYGDDGDNGNGNGGNIGGRKIGWAWTFGSTATLPMGPVNAPAYPGSSGSSSTSELNYYQADRSPNEMFMKACSLEEITYPTGGKTRFEFEGNKYGNTVVGGLRIKSIINYIDGKPIKKIYYDYSSGIMPPLYESYRGWEYEQVYGFTLYCFSGDEIVSGATCCPVLRSLHCYNTSPLIPNRYSNGNVVYYETVIETVCDGDSIPQERNIYTYDIGDGEEDMDETYSGIYSGYPVARTYNMGNLLKLEHKIYNANTNKFDPRRKITNTYTTYGKKKEIVGTIIRPEVMFFNQDCSRDYFIDQHRYECLDIKAESGINKITKTVTTDYLDDNSTQTNEVNYVYDNNHYLLREEARTSSDGKTIVTKRTYPSDYYVYPYTTMSTKNMFNFPVETVTTVNNDVTQAFVTEYGKVCLCYNPNSDDVICPLRRSSLNINNPIPVSSYIDFNGSSLDNRCEEDESYRYYCNGNIQEIVNPKTGITTIVIWSYNNKYPIAEIVNASFSNVEAIVKSKFSVANLDVLSSSPAPNAELLRNGTLQNALPDAMVTTYTYKPLVGMTSKTDPHGETIYYEYDSAGRLSKIKDKDNKTIEEYEYHYKP